MTLADEHIILNDSSPPGLPLNRQGQPDSGIATAQKGVLPWREHINSQLTYQLSTPKSTRTLNPQINSQVYEMLWW